MFFYTPISPDRYTNLFYPLILPPSLLHYAAHLCYTLFLPPYLNSQFIPPLAVWKGEWGPILNNSFLKSGA